MDQEHLIRLLMRERTKLSAYILSFVHNRNTAEDIFQDVSVLTLQNQATMVDEAHFLNWLHRVARQRCVNFLRKHRREVLQLDQDVLQLLESQWANYERNSSQGIFVSLESCVAKLTANNQRLISLRFVEDIRGEELARRMGRNVNAVHVALSRVYRVLAECVQRHLADEAY